MEKFREFVAKDGVNTATNELIDRFVESIRKNKTRRMDQAEKKSKVHFTEDVMGISSDMYIQCLSNSNHRYPLTLHSSKKKKSLTVGGKKEH